MFKNNMFNDSNIDPMTGTELLNIMGISALDLKSPDVAAKYQTIAQYFGRFEDGPALARRIGRNVSPEERMAKILEYTLLRKDLDGVREELKSMPTDDSISNEVAREELMQREAAIINEIQYYE